MINYDKNVEALVTFKEIKKVHEVNRDKGKEQLLSAYRKAGWMSPELSSIIDQVVNNCKICQKVSKVCSKAQSDTSKSNLI